MMKRLLNGVMSHMLMFSSLLLLIIVCGPLFAQPNNPNTNDTDQVITFGVPSKISLHNPGGDKMVNYTAQTTKKYAVHTQDWEALSNWSQGDTEIDFQVKVWDHKNEDYQRKAIIEITSSTGNWGNLSTTTGEGKGTPSDTDGDENSITFSKGLASPGNGFGGKTLSGDISVRVFFKHLDADKTENGDYLAPSGDWETTVTGTITAKQ